MAITPSTFQTGANDALSAIDVYNQTGASVINSIRGTTGYIKSLDKALASGLGGVSIDGIPVSSILNMSNGQLMVNPDAMLKAALKDSPQLMSAYQSLSDARRVTFTALQDLTSMVRVTKGAAQQFLNSAPINDIRAIVGMVMAVAEGCPLFPNFIIEDIGALKFLLSQLIKEATSIGLTGLYAGFSGCPKFSEDTMRGVTRNLTDTLYSSCSANLLFEIAEGGGGKFLLEQDPNLFRSFLNKYESKYASSNASWSAIQKTLSQDIKIIFSAFTLIDPLWRFSPLSKDVTALNARVLDRATEDVFTLLRHAYYESQPNIKDNLNRVRDTNDWAEFDTSKQVPEEFHYYTLRRKPKLIDYDAVLADMIKSMHFKKRK